MSLEMLTSKLEEDKVDELIVEQGETSSLLEKIYDTLLDSLSFMKLTEAMRVRNNKLTGMDNLEGYLEGLLGSGVVGGGMGKSGGIPIGRQRLQDQHGESEKPEGLTSGDLLKASILGNSIGALETLFGVGMMQTVGKLVSTFKSFFGKLFKFGAIITAVLTLVNNLSKIDWDGEGVFEQIQQALLQTKTDMVRMLFDFVVGIPYAVAGWALDAIGMHDTANAMREHEAAMREGVNDAMTFVDKVIFSITDFFTERIRGFIDHLKGLAIGFGIDPNSKWLRVVKTGLGMDDIGLDDMTTNKRGILGSNTESKHYKKQLAKRAALAIRNVKDKIEGINTGPTAITPAQAMYMAESNAEGVADYPEVKSALDEFYNSREISRASENGVQPEKYGLDPITGPDTDPRLADGLISASKTPVMLGGDPKLKRKLYHNNYFTPQTLQEAQITPFIGRNTQGGLMQRGSELMTQGKEWTLNKLGGAGNIIAPLMQDINNSNTTVTSNTTKIDMGPTVPRVDRNQVNGR